MITIMSTKHLITILLCIFGCLSSAFMSFRIMQEKTSKGQMLFVLLMSGSLVMNLGTLLEICTLDVHAMIIAIKIGYIGRIFLTLLMPEFLAEYFHNPIPKWLQRIFWMINLGYIAVIMSIGYNKLYYQTYGIKYGGDFPILTKNVGPLYYPFIIEICGIMGYIVFLTGRNLCRNRKGIEKKRYLYMTIGSCLPAIDILIYQSHSVIEFDYISFVMTISGILFYRAIRKYHAFDLEQNAKDFVLDNSAEAVLVLDPDLKILYFNQPFENWFTKLELFTRFPDSYLNVWNKEEGNEFVYGDFIFEFQKTDLIRKDDTLEGYLFEIINITEEKRDIEKMNELREAAEIANQKKSSFLANMSHEIRTPINAIVGMDEMILREGEEKNILDYADSIQSSAKSLLYLINDILDFSKLESGKMQLIPVKYDIRTMTNHMIQVLKGRNLDLPAKVRVDLLPETPRGILGDEVRMKQMLSNMYVNTLKYCHRENIKITMGYERTEETYEDMPKIYILIKIREYGKIIRTVNREALYSSIKENIENLSIAIVNELLCLMEAQMTHIKEEDKDGIDVRIPQGLVDDTMAGEGVYFDSEEKIEEQKNEILFQAPGKEILVVDDNHVNLKVMVGLLKRTKVSVTTATSGEECLDLVTKHKYDIIFMDHLMPEMDGIETLQEMRRLKDTLNPNTPVIALTANAIAGAREMYLQEGFSDYLMKPVRGKELEHMMGHFLTERKEAYR